MKANMAIGLIACGLALACLVGTRRSPIAATTLASLAGVLGALTFAEHVFGWNLHIDELLFREAPGAAGTTSPGRMGPNGALSLCLASCALMALGRRTSTSTRVTQLLGSIMAVLATVALAGYGYGAEQLYAIARYSGIAWPTAASLLALSIGILTARTDAGLVAILAGAGPGGVMARRLLAPAIFLPLFVGYLRILGQRAGLYDTALGTALFAIALVVVFVLLIWRTAGEMNAVDSERQRAEQARADLLTREQRARAEVEQANRLKDHFLATLSHELRTPLNAILGYTRMLRTDAIPRERRSRALEVIERNATAQNQLVEDLLDMSRMTTGRIRLERQVLPIISPLREALESVKPSGDAKRIRFAVEADEFAGNVNGDEGRLRQIFWNVLANAVKFTGEDGRIFVGLANHGDAVEITVRDSGIGIDPGFLPHIFEPFRQADVGFSRSVGGLGLGLAICKQLAELHGGSIAAQSAGPGHGTTFTVRLPRHSPEIAPIAGAGSTVASQPSQGPARRLEGVDILVVDDEQDNRELLHQLLENVGARVRLASTAGEAMQACHERRPDLLVADLGLPEVDGCELLRRIRAQFSGHPPVPAIAVTAYARSDDRAKTFAAGFQDHIAKPIDPDAFLQAVAKAAQQPI
jgi:signal transduction histidine kinase/CheY-like chemotaxis protein